MLALVLDDAPRVIRDAARPPRPPGEALVAMRMAGVCDTDLQLARGYMGFRGVLGHELVGEVVEADDPAWLGRRVVADINAGCGACPDCRDHRGHHCPTRTVLGILGRGGALAELVAVPERCLVAVPADLADELAVFAEPVAAALHVLDALGPADDRAIVLGERLDTLHVLVNNAGIFSPERVITGDGIEMTLAVNHVGHYLLTELLRPALRKAGSARVLIVSSIAHTRGRIHLEDLTLEKAYTGYAAYAQSKLANVMHALDLAAASDPAELAVYALHPGVISTKLLREGFGPVRGSSPHHGAATSIRLATAPTIVEPSGTYFSEGYPTPVAAAANDASVRTALRAATLRYAKLEAS